jgi:hypothetical protein
MQAEWYSSHLTLPLLLITLLRLSFGLAFGACASAVCKPGTIKFIYSLLLPYISGDTGTQVKLTVLLGAHGKTRCI